MTPEVRENLIDRVSRNPYVKHLQIEFTKVEEGLVEARMPLFEEQRQYSGVIHGGVLAALADTVAGFVTYTMTPEDKDVLTAELKTSFLRATWGKELIAKGYMVKPGRNVHFSECEIYCEGKLVCKASGTFSVVRKQV
ncbi:PaaI family thioesterase [Bacteroides sp. 214]|uniref:PaaI family thioesterase n=1 Tax=Bacteroides sp. 214 TaxID=2302935 RepID=UPI0013D34104|nr:PaaI family thioesterase [Bacteroides sp. 214]NDW13733.1 PaaI family thioesterase [Bacteroides sp. 214]